MPEFNDTCDYHVEVMAKSKNSLKLLVDGEDEHWIPFNQICDSSEVTEDSDKGDEGVITVSEWIAVQEGLE